MTDKGLQPRRTLNRLGLAGAGLVFGLLGQYFLGQNVLADGLLFYAVAVVLFSRALAGRLPSLPRSKLLPFSETIHQSWRLYGGSWLVMFAVALSVFTYRFYDNGEIRLAWWFYLAGLGLLIVGTLLLSRDRSGAGWGSLLPGREISLGLLLILGLALFMRLYRFESLPFGIWFDEAEAGLQARRMLIRADYWPLFYPPINISGHLLALYSLALRWFGNTIEAMRLVSVLFGVGGVMAAYLFGRELYGPRFGLALAFLVAAARWHITFSRIAMTGIDTPFLEFLSLFFLVRAWRYGGLREAMWAGLSLGMGLVLYTAFRLYVAALLIFLLIAGLIWLSRYLRRPRPKADEVGETDRPPSNSPFQGENRLAPPPEGGIEGGAFAHAEATEESPPLPPFSPLMTTRLVQLLLLTISVWLVVMPLVKFAFENPEAFWLRTRQVSIFTKRDEPLLNRALWQSAHKHLLMFNYRGDKNGRHNLPGEPMLDPITGLLFVLGFSLAVSRMNNPAHGFFLLLFPLALVGGIFSVDFEAPQSLRSIAVMPAVFYFAGLSVAALGREAERAFRPLPRRWLLLPALLVAGYIVYTNGYIYFVRQAKDFASWNAYSAPETLTGRKMAELGPDYTYILSPFLTNHPTIRFLAPDITHQQYLRLPDALPIREPPTRPVALFVHPDESWVFKEAQRYYPEAAYEIATGPNDGPPAVYFAEFRPADLASIQGLELYYREAEADGWPEPDDYDSLLKTGYVKNINATWPAEGPEAGRFVAEWRGILYAPFYGPYSFRLITPGPARLEIDGNLILEGRGEQLSGLPLAQGNHSLRVLAQSGPGQVALYWQPPAQREEMLPQWALYIPPVTNNGLLGTFYPNDSWTGQAAFKRIDPFLDTYFHLTPLPRPYTVEWVGSVDIPRSGFYQLGLRAVHSAQLYLDGELLVNAETPNQYTDAGRNLEAGLHDLKIRFLDSEDRSRIHLYWTRPEKGREPIPGENLWPPLGRDPRQKAEPPPVETASVRLSWLNSIGGFGREPGQFFEPRDMAVLSNGNLAVADTFNRRGQILSSQGRPLQMLADAEFPFEEPLAVGVNSRDEILILDSSLQWVYRFDAEGNLLGRFGGPDAYLFHPRGLTVFEDDSIAIADTGQSRLALFNGDGIQAGSIGGLGDGPGQFGEPTDVVRDAQGNYFVAEADNDRIQLVDGNGNPLGQWAIPPAYAYDGPHLALGPDGSLFVTDAQGGSLLRYAPDGSLLDQWHTIDGIGLVSPVGIYFDPAANRLYLSDIYTHLIHVFAVELGG